MLFLVAKTFKKLIQYTKYKQLLFLLFSYTTDFRIIEAKIQGRWKSELIVSQS